MAEEAHMTAKNESERAMLNTANPNVIAVVHRAPISAKYYSWLCCLGCMAPLSCLCCTRRRLVASTYVQVHENRVEFDYPNVHCLDLACGACYCCRVHDNVTTLYFDKYPEIGRAGCCSPACTHCSCCPTCCDSCGEGVVVYRHECCCCKTWHLISHLEDADNVIKAFEAAKNAKLSNQPPPPPIVMN
eukprot:m51a1_g6105 hypothetical protein (188) ;mRNA; f:81676-82575